MLWLCFCGHRQALPFCTSAGRSLFLSPSGLILFSDCSLFVFSGYQQKYFLSMGSLPCVFCRGTDPRVPSLISLCSLLSLIPSAGQPLCARRALCTEMAGAGSSGRCRSSSRLIPATRQPALKRKDAFLSTHHLSPRERNRMTGLGCEWTCVFGAGAKALALLKFPGC